MIKVGDHRITDAPHTFNGFNQGMHRGHIVKPLNLQLFCNTQHQQLRHALAGRRMVVKRRTKSFHL